MNDKIKEKLALYRLILSFDLLAIFGIVGWTYRIYEKFGVDRITLGLAILFFFIIFTAIMFYKIIKLIKEL